MAKFCTKCGKQLKDGEQCSCQAEKAVGKTNSSSSNSASIVTTIINLIKGMFTEPVKTMKSFISEDNFNNGLIAIGVSSVAAAVLMAVLCKELFATIIGLVGVSSGFSTTGLSMTGLMDQIEIPYVKIVLITIIAVIAVDALIAGIAYLISEKLFKSTTSFKKMLTWMGATSGLLTVVYLATALCALINLNLALVVFAAGSMLNTYYTYRGLSFACDTDENKLGYILMPAVLVTTFVVGYILPNLVA